jgi:hypothetical protein
VALCGEKNEIPRTRGMGPPLAHCKDSDLHYDKASYRLTREPSDVMPGADAWLGAGNFWQGRALSSLCTRSASCINCIRGQQVALFLVLIP